MQFSATETATKPLYPHLTSEAVPVISFLHPEFEVVRSNGRYRLLSGGEVSFVATDRWLCLGQRRAGRRCMVDKALPRGARRLAANEMSEFREGMVALRPAPPNVSADVLSCSRDEAAYIAEHS